MEAIENILEALLFTAGKPLRAKELAKILELEESAVKAALEAIAEKTKNSGCQFCIVHILYRCTYWCCRRGWLFRF